MNRIYIMLLAQGGSTIIQLLRLILEQVDHASNNLEAILQSSAVKKMPAHSTTATSESWPPRTEQQQFKLINLNIMLPTTALLLLVDHVRLGDIRPLSVVAPHVGSDSLAECVNANHLHILCEGAFLAHRPLVLSARREGYK